VYERSKVCIFSPVLLVFCLNELHNEVAILKRPGEVQRHNFRTADMGTK